MPSKEELKMLQALPLDIKIRKTEIRIEEFVEHFGIDNVYVSFSGGKDSTVLLDIARRKYPNVLAIFSDTGLEYPEIKEFVKTFDNVETVRPLLNFREVIIKHGYPIVGKEVSSTILDVRRNIKNKNTNTVRYRQLHGLEYKSNGQKSEFNKEKYKCLLDAPFLISDQCCNEMKKKPLKKIKKFPLIATMAVESKRRESKWIKRGCNIFDGKTMQGNPISFWTERDVLHYIKEKQINICSVYGEICFLDDDSMVYSDELFSQFMELKFTGCQRTGCVFCGFGAHLEKGESRFQRLKRTHPKLYSYCINGGGRRPNRWNVEAKQRRTWYGICI